MRYLFIVVLIIVMAFPAYAEKYVVVNADESIQTIEDKASEVLMPGMERFTIADEDKPSESTNYYIFDKTNEVFVRKDQAVIDDMIAEEAVDNLIIDLLEKEKKKAAAKEAIKDNTLDQKVIDKLQEIIDG